MGISILACLVEGDLLLEGALIEALQVIAEETLIVSVEVVIHPIHHVVDVTLKTILIHLEVIKTLDLDIQVILRSSVVEAEMIVTTDAHHIDL